MRELSTPHAGPPVIDAMRERMVAGRTKPGAVESTRLRSRSALPGLRLEECLCSLQRVAGVPQGRPHAALSSLRIDRARASGLPGLWQCRRSTPWAAAPNGWKSTLTRADARARASGASTPTPLAPRVPWRHNWRSVHAGRRRRARGHANGGQGPRLSTHHVGCGGRIRIRRAVLQRFPRRPSACSALLMQAAGRAGRDAAVAARSEMWIQTWHPGARALCGSARPMITARFATHAARGTPHGRAAAVHAPGACCGPKLARRKAAQAFLGDAGARHWGSALAGQDARR